MISFTTRFFWLEEPRNLRDTCETEVLCIIELYQYDFFEHWPISTRVFERLFYNRLIMNLWTMQAVFGSSLIHPNWLLSYKASGKPRGKSIHLSQFLLIHRRLNRFKMLEEIINRVCVVDLFTFCLRYTESEFKDRKFNRKYKFRIQRNWEWYTKHFYQQRIRTTIIVVKYLAKISPVAQINM